MIARRRGEKLGLARTGRRVVRGRGNHLLRRRDGTMIVVPALVRVRALVVRGLVLRGKAARHAKVARMVLANVARVTAVLEIGRHRGRIVVLADRALAPA
jgi:hypothetical protein